MTIQSVNKVKLFLSGIMSRLNENLSYFISIHISFKSGLKEFAMDFKNENGKIIYAYLGDIKAISTDEILACILDELLKYESAVISYRDRISGIDILCDDKNVSSKNVSGSDFKEITEKTTVGGRKYIITENEAKELLTAIGIMAKNGKIKNDMIRKYNQIDRFIELISDIEFGNNINIMDCACGKIYLSFVVNYFFTEKLKKKCSVYGIDIKENVIKESNRIKNELKYNNMEFIKADLKNFVLGKNVDLVISLHACDVATDYALYSGIKNNAKAIIAVPCCHKQLSDQIEFEPFEDIFKYGIFKNRFSDILTDSLRTLLLESRGYKVSVIEYISPLDSPKNIMLKAVKTRDFNDEALKKYNSLKNMFNVFPKLEELLLTDY